MAVTVVTVFIVVEPMRMVLVYSYTVKRCNDVTMFWCCTRAVRLADSRAQGLRSTAAANAEVAGLHSETDSLYAPNFGNNQNQLIIRVKQKRERK